MRQRQSFAALGVQAKIDRLDTELPDIHVIFTLAPKPNRAFKVEKDVPTGAEGMCFLWFAVNSKLDTLHFAGREFVQCKRNCKFIGLGAAEGMV